MSSLRTTNIPAEHSEAILREMFKRVNVDYDTFDFKQDNWYWEHEWSIEEQDEFSKWVAEYLFKNKLFKKSKYRGVPEHLYRAKQIVFNYGWKCSEEKI